jgi:hypothetical protein
LAAHLFAERDGKNILCLYPPSVDGIRGQEIAQLDAGGTVTTARDGGRKPALTSGRGRQWKDNHPKVIKTKL